MTTTEAALRDALEKIERLGSDGEHSGDRHARCRDIAREALSQPPASSTVAQAILAPECCDEFDTNPDCACPHEHWHVGRAGTCLDIHIEEEGYTHLTIDFGDGSHEVELHGISTLDAARPIAFLWAGTILGQTLSPLSGEPASVAGLREALERLRIMAKQKLSSELDEEEQERADWQGAYDFFCTESRAALAALSETPE